MRVKYGNPGNLSPGCPKLYEGEIVVVQLSDI
jgi:hypothetical protein